MLTDDACRALDASCMLQALQIASSLGPTFWACSLADGAAPYISECFTCYIWAHL
jgi:hypothetical protein